MLRRLLRGLAFALLALLLLPIPFVVAYRFVAPPVTPLMLLRHAFEGEPIRQAWLPYERIPAALARAVVASEDARFCRHHGFDWVELEHAWLDFRARGRLRGASTISQQAARNLFLWPGGGVPRKLAEAYLTVLLELFWSKARILEVYLNIIEWGHGVYGAEAAARAHFGEPAGALAAGEAARLAAVLPNPRRWAAEHPTLYIDERARIIARRMAEAEIPGAAGCR